MRNIFQTATLAISFLLAPLAAKADDGVPPVHIAKFAGDRAAAISYTFDDNLRDQYTLAVPMLNEVGYKGTFFVIPGRTAETPEEAKQKAGATRAWGSISWPELKEMAAQGHEIANHTWSHRNMQQMPAEEVESEFKKAAEAIRTRIGQAPLTIAFPFNASTPEVKAAALKHHVAYRAYQTSISGKSTAESLNTWAGKLVEEKKWGVIMAHGIGSGYAALTDPEIFRLHLKYVKGRETDIWVDTFANIARYEKEREDSKLVVTGGAGKATCILTGTLDPQIYTVPLTLVLEVPGATSARAERGGVELPVRIKGGSLLLEAAPGPHPIIVTWK